MAYLLLEDGTVYQGVAFGSAQDVVGEVVFNTGMAGYQELLTDPSYYGQIVVMTYPLIGNYGYNKLDVESDSIHLGGFITSQACTAPSNWKSEGTIHEYLCKHVIPAMSDMDTRAITKKIRSHGSMIGMICQSIPADAMEQIKSYSISKPVNRVTCQNVYKIPSGKKKVAVLDFGLKKNILRSLSARGLSLTVFPADTSASEILSGEFDGVMLTNGPGNPKDNTDIIKAVKELMDNKPVFGICLGFQLMSLAVGADTHKMLYGHRGCNHPVKDYLTARTYITSQNHGYAVIESTLPKNVEVTHLNWNDKTVEGIKLLDKPCFGVQFHPEACPGPQDTAYLFDRFLALL